MQLKFSANVGFLWEHLPLPDRILAAANAGFDAVECHFPYEHESTEISAVLKNCGLPMVGINTLLGPPDEALFGVCALPGRETLAHQYIDQAISYASAVDAGYVNVVAGASAQQTTSEDVFRENLSYACKQANNTGITIVFEPLNPRAVPNYHVSKIEQAVSTVDAVAEDNLKIMFDCFHSQIVQGDLAMLLSTYLDYIAHVQISAVHDRGEPDCGEINYPFLLQQLSKLGYAGYIGAEYKPRGRSVEAGLGWLDQFRQYL